MVIAYRSNDTNLTARFVTMKTFSPEFSQHWVTGPAEGMDDTRNHHRDNDALSPSQQEALEALAERVNAARSTV